MIMKTTLVAIISVVILSWTCASSDDSTCPEGNVRLRGGTMASGRVEVCKNNSWGTVCGNFWDDSDAMVVCRQLGFPPDGLIGSQAILNGFTSGLLDDKWILLDQVQCIGNETSLLDCPTEDLNVNCSHNQDAGVSCVEIPGSPSNLSVQYDSQACESVELAWNPPEQESGALLSYRVDVLKDVSTVTNITDYNLTSVVLDNLECCTDYFFTVVTYNEYGLRSPFSVLNFRTPPPANPLNVTASSVNSTSIAVDFTVNEGFQFANVIVQGQCLSGALPPISFAINKNTNTSLVVNSLEPYVPYKVQVVAAVCDNVVVTVYNDTVYTKQPSVPEIPTIQVLRLDPPSAVITIAYSLRHQYYQVELYNSTTDNQSLDIRAGPVRSFRTVASSSQFTLLQECQDYWVIVSAVSCGLSASSTPAYVDVYNPTQFTATIRTSVLMPCETWISTNTGQKIADVQTFILGVLSSCGYSVNCRAASNFSCQAVNEVTLSVTLASTVLVSSQDQADCLTTSLEAGRNVILGGTQSTILTGGQVTTELDSSTGTTESTATSDNYEPATTKSSPSTSGTEMPVTSDNYEPATTKSSPSTSDTEMPVTSDNYEPATTKSSFSTSGTEMPVTSDNYEPATTKSSPSTSDTEMPVTSDNYEPETTKSSPSTSDTEMPVTSDNYETETTKSNGMPASTDGASDNSPTAHSGIDRLSLWIWVAVGVGGAILIALATTVICTTTIVVRKQRKIRGRVMVSPYLHNRDHFQTSSSYEELKNLID